VRAEAHSKSSECKNRDSGERAKAATLARFLISLLTIASVSDQ
jgi:hypothetical protein